MLGGVGVTDGLHAVPLGHVPDLELQVGLAIRGPAAKQGQQEDRGQDKGRQPGDPFHNSTPLFMVSARRTGIGTGPPKALEK